MEVQIAGTNIELTDRVRHYVERKLGKLSRHLKSILETRVEITEEKTRAPEQRYNVRVTVKAAGTTLHGEERGEDLFTAIDKVADIMVRQADDFKGKLYEKGRGISVARSVPSEATQPLPPTREVVKVKRFVLKPMTVTEAAGQMELLGHDFFLFYNSETEETNLLYLRKDGNYGLIEVELG